MPKHPARPTPQRPKSVSVSGMTWKIEFCTKERLEEMAGSSYDEGMMGLTNFARNHGIYIDQDTVESMLRDTLLHEILHVCWYIGMPEGSGVPENGDYQELAVSALDTPLLDVLSGNPKLTAWLTVRG